MRADASKDSGRALLILLVTYAAASLLHYAHNAEFLADYPNMPAWLSRATVYVAWLSGATVGALGYLLIRRGRTFAGLSVIVLYAALGFDVLAHYSLAPVSAHTAAMNLTIWLEVISAAVLMIAACRGIVILRKLPTG